MKESISYLYASQFPMASVGLFLNFKQPHLYSIQKSISCGTTSTFLSLFGERSTNNFFNN